MSQIYEFLSEALRAWDEKDVRALKQLEVQLRSEGRDIEGLSDQDIQIRNELESDTRKLLGSLVSANRLSVDREGTISDDLLKAIERNTKRLSPEGRELLFPASDSPPIPPSIGPVPELETDSPFREIENEALESVLARELIDLLPGVTEKSGSLQIVELDRIPNSNVRGYFKEAHRCYLYGLQGASLAMCRALLESALKDIYGSSNNFFTLEQMAKDRLDGERLHALHAVKTAGDLAVHDRSELEKRFLNSDMERMLLDTRKILEDLYAKRA